MKRVLVEQGKLKIEWARQHMPVLNAVRARFEREKPLAGLQVGICLHLEAKTAYLAQVLAVAGAQVAIAGSNPLSTQDDVAAALAESGVAVFARRGSTPEEYQRFLMQVAETQPHLIIDDGGDLVHLFHTEATHLAGRVRGGCEETTTGVLRLKAMAREGVLSFPMLSVNDAYCKYLFDNRYGTGQSTWDAIMRTTNRVIAGAVVVVVGYGWCGRGIAMRAKGLGAQVIVTEVNPIRAIEAQMDGFQVMSLREAAPLGQFFVTATGCKDAIARPHLEVMRDGAILANAGHFDVEISKPDLTALSVERRQVRAGIEEYRLRDGRRLYLLGEGRLVNLVCGDGHPVEIMDLSFALQALSVEYVSNHSEKLGPGVHPVPREIDEQVARLKLEAAGVHLDSLTPEQEAYLRSWQSC